MLVRIIGGGPIGGYMAYQLAKNNIPIHLHEQGDGNNPERCTGLISTNLDKHIKIPKRLILNRIKGATISCGKTTLEIETPETKAYVFNRTNLDKHIINKAEQAGAKIHYNSIYQNNNTRKAKINNQTFPFTKLIGCDGPYSRVANNNNMWYNRQFWHAIQYKIKLKNQPTDKVQLHLDKKYGDFFAWIVPETEDIYKIGLGTTKNNPKQLLQKFINDKAKGSIQSCTAGEIPIWQNIQPNNHNIYLIGDAALQVKATTGGGINTGMVACKALLKSFLDSKPYKHELLRLDYNLHIHKTIREQLDKLNDKKRETLLKTIEPLKHQLIKHGDMDDATKIYDIFSVIPQIRKLII